MVLDLTNFLAGPFCCHQLVHLGANVINIEVAGQSDFAYAWEQETKDRPRLNFSGAIPGRTHLKKCDQNRNIY